MAIAPKPVESERRTKQLTEEKNWKWKRKIKEREDDG
jgi:hypothetical protein